MVLVYSTGHKSLAKWKLSDQTFPLFYFWNWVNLCGLHNALNRLYRRLTNLSSSLCPFNLLSSLGRQLQPITCPSPPLQLKLFTSSPVHLIYCTDPPFNRFVLGYLVHRTCTQGRPVQELCCTVPTLYSPTNLVNFFDELFRILISLSWTVERASTRSQL